MSELLVKVRTQDGGEIIGVVVGTHVVPQQTEPQFDMTPDKQLIQTGPKHVRLVVYATVVHPGGFVVCPLTAVVPLFPPDFPGMPQSSCRGEGCDGDNSCDDCPKMPEEKKSDEPS